MRANAQSPSADFTSRQGLDYKWLLPSFFVLPEALRSFSLKFYVLDVRTLTNFFFFFQPIPLHYVVLKKTGKTLKGWRLSWLLAQVWSPLPCLVVAETLANLYAYNPLMRLFRHFSTLLWENALFPSLPPPPSKSLAHSKSVNEPALLLVRNNKDPRVGVPFIRQWKMRSSTGTTPFSSSTVVVQSPPFCFLDFKWWFFPYQSSLCCQLLKKCILFTAFGSSFKQALSFSIVLCCLHFCLLTKILPDFIWSFLFLLDGA